MCLHFRIALDSSELMLDSSYTGYFFEVDSTPIFTSGVNEEENWDDEGINPYQIDLPIRQQSAPVLEIVEDHHYFLPAEFHSTSHVKSPHSIDAIDGQFDDAD